jgi:branched-subunit amino acid transport protein AzlD
MNTVSILKQDRWNWLHSFMLIQFMLQILLLIPGIGTARTLIRIGSFGLSLYLLFTLTPPGKQIDYPGKWLAYCILGILGLAFCFNFHLNTIPAGLGQIAMYLSIIGPLFWVSKVPISVAGFRNLLVLIWVFQATSAIFGLLQVYLPGQLQFQVSSVITSNPYGGEDLKIVLDNGASIYRPSGLTDMPGGAALAGLYAVLLGLAFFLEGKSKLLAGLGLLSTFIGFFCIYMSQVRSMLIATCVCIGCLLLILAVSRNFKRAVTLVGTIQPIVLGTFGWAAAVGGTGTLNRITSLFAGSADQVYQQNRGHFLEDTIDILLPKYPWGAGLGRWGMMNSYFGNNDNPFTEQIWVEIQWTGWLLDGGIPLVATYSAALVLASYLALKIACQRRSDGLSFWSAIIFSYNIGMLMITFNYPLFMSQTGMEFWLLNTGLFMASLQPQQIVVTGEFVN